MTFKEIKNKLEEECLSGKGNLYELNFSDASQILINSSFLFYEFEDKEVSYSYDNSDTSLGEYTRQISPLFIKGVINSPLNNKLLNIIDEEVPLYHLQPEEVSEDMGLQELSSTRDCGINNTHNVLRESSFYQVWLRDVFGSIQNQLLLDAYNKLRWPLLSENQYLMADLFPSLAMEAFNSDREGEEATTDLLIEFRETVEENEEDNGFTETINGEASSLKTKRGGIDYLNEIVKEKLSSSYEILDYHPGRVDAITAWGESLYESGQILKEELEKQLIIYKLQDVKYELLKRKYAGTKTLYTMVMSSLNRQGSFVSAVPLSSVTTKNETDDYFIDKRLIRIIDLPGITTELSGVKIFPLNYIPEGEFSPSINDVSSLYYSSGQDYNAENFYSVSKKVLSGGDSGESVSVDAIGGEVGLSLLRKNVKYVNWNHLQGVSKGQLSSVVYSTLDERRIDSEAATDDGKVYIQLDTRNPKDKNSNPLYKKKSDGSSEKAEYSFLDYSTPSIDFTAESNITTKDIVDINADRLLFNKNTLQKETGENYPYVTYSIASGNSVSLMDPTWLDYIQTSIETKSKVQEDITYGVQVNKYYKLGGVRQGEYSFFAISFSKEEGSASEDPDSVNLESLKTNPGEYDEDLIAEGGAVETPYPKYTYLWYCTVKYEVGNFKVQSFDKILISRITNKLKVLDPTFKGIEEYEELGDFSRGVLPFTYFKLSEDRVLGLKYGVIEDDWYDDIEKAGYAKANFLFSSSDFPYTYRKEGLLEKIEGKTFSKEELLNIVESIPGDGGLSCAPIYRSKGIKTVYYAVKKGNDSYVCSAPIRVFNLAKVNFEKGETFYPDWYDICYFLNPYLNFTRNSASPLRGKRVISVESARDNGILDTVEQVSDNIYLSNLTRFRSKDFLCADENTKETRWLKLYKEDHPAKKYSGFYLKKHSLSIPEGEDSLNDTLSTLEVGKNVVAIYGDPRGQNLYDLKIKYDEEKFGALSSDTRTKVFTNEENGIKCLHFESKLGNQSPPQDIMGSEYSYEYFTLEPPCGEYEKWWWNIGSDTTIRGEEEPGYAGISIFINISLNVKEKDIERNNKVCLLEREGEFNLSIVNLEIDNNKKVKGRLSFTYNGISYNSPGDLYTLGPKNNTRIGVTVVEGKVPLIIVDNDLKSLGTTGVSSLCNKINNTHPIYLGMSSDGKTQYFLGEIYELRLYNRGMSEKELRILNSGSFRETYSYSPESFVLGYNNYVDIGIFKEVSPRLGDAEGTIDEITGLRAFNRSVWDSILVDRCPITDSEMDEESPFYKQDATDPLNDSDVYGWVKGEKALKDCVEISLGGFEALNNTLLKNSTGNNLNIKYYGEDITVAAGDKTSIINTLIYPVAYDKDILRDNNVAKFYLIKEAETEDTIVTGSTGNLSTTQGFILPKVLTSMEGNLKYEADLNLNFTIDTSSNFTNYYSKGSNITLKYNNLLGKAVVVRTDESVSSSANNHILIPITVPKQQSLTSEDLGCLDRFYLSGVELNSGINILLRATSYYNELRIPVAMDTITNGTHGVIYASKWDAIRTLKEGTYYITCKYPFQLLPFTDAQYDVTNRAKYNYLYASVRFKIEISGTPVKYSIGENGAEDITSSYITAYNKENIASTLKSTSALFDPTDNRTFPHRKINIDFYVQECSSFAGRMMVSSDGTASENYDYSWKLLGTNHPDDYKSSDSWVYLTKQKLENNLTITSDIPLFFSKNFTSPFFIAKSEKKAGGTSKVNSASADDDLIDPVRINPLYNSVKLVSYIRAIGVADVETTYYTKEGNSYYIASPQPEGGESLEKDTVYYVRQENLDNLQVEKEKDLDNLVIVAGRSYKLLWDYTGCVSEIAFTDKVYSGTSEAKIKLASSTDPTYGMGSSEKTNYARLSSLMNFDTAGSIVQNESDYAYTEDGMGYRLTDVQLAGKTSGYQISNGEYISCYIFEGLSSGDNLTPEFVKSLRTSPSQITAEIGGSYYTSRVKATLISYEIKTVDSESKIPTVIGASEVYNVTGDSRYYYDNNKTSVTSSSINILDLNSLEEGTWDDLEIGSFYRSGSSDKLFRFGITLDNVIFKCGASYFIWDLFDKKKVTVDSETYESESYCPQEENSLKYYPSKNSQLGYRFVNSGFSHFTEVSPKTQENGFSASAFYFGNPYSRSSNKNYLLGIRDVASSYSRNNITNSWYFPYVPTEIPENQYLSSSLLTSSTPLNVKISSTGDTSQICIDEEKIIKAQHNNTWSTVKVAIATLVGKDNATGSSGIFTALSSIRPGYYYSSDSTMVNTESYIRDVNEDLISYLAADRVYPSKNENITITRRGLYSNNLISNQDLDNRGYWTWGGASKVLGLGSSDIQNLYSKSYVSDDSWDDGVGKDVCEVTYYGIGDGLYSNAGDPLSVKYTKGGTSVGYTYEVALNIKVEGEAWNGKSWSPNEPRYYKYVLNEEGTKYVISECTDNVVCLEYWPENSTYKTGTIVVRKDILEARLYTGDANQATIPLNLLQYENNESIDIPEKESDVLTLEKNLYVDVKANKIKVRAAFLSKGKKVGDLIHLKVSALSQQENTSSFNGLVAFDNQWYTISAEPSTNVVADSVAFIFECEDALKFRITKAVVRASSAQSHTLGLSDGIRTKGTSSEDSSVTVTSHHCISYRNKDTKELIPIQFNAVLGKRISSSSYVSDSIYYPISGLSNAMNFIQAYSLGFESSNNKVEKLMNPWKRKLYYKRSVSTETQDVYFDEVTGLIYEEYYNTSSGTGGYCFRKEISPVENKYYYFLNGVNDEVFEYNSSYKEEGSSKYIRKYGENGRYYTYQTNGEAGFFTALERVPFDVETYFHKYEVRMDNKGIKTEVENSLATGDLYKNPVLELRDGGERNYIVTTNLTLDKSSSSILNKYNTNLQVTKGSKSYGHSGSEKIISMGPLSVSNAKISALTNCFDYDKYKNRETNNIAITNLQILGKASASNKRVLFEVEYPPIIYKEREQHLSINILLQRESTSRSGSEED